MSIPTTMRALVAPRKCRPEAYEVIELPVPSITLPTDVLLKIHAASVNTGELQAMDGRFGLIYTPK
jgi:NADPH:quinone reductase-like Zn-dependent oxidoreductase